MPNMQRLYGASIIKTKESNMFFKKVVLITVLLLSALPLSACKIPSCGPGTGGPVLGPLSAPAPKTAGIRVPGVPGKVVVLPGKRGELRVCYIPDKFLK